MKIALVTGSTSGIGYEISKRLLKMNYTVYGIGRNFIKNNENIFGEYKNFIPVTCDLSKLDNLEKTLHSLKKINFDLIVNSAGVGYFGLHEEMNISKIKNMISINLQAPLVISQYFLRTLKENKGIIINISSVTANKESPLASVYSATKAGLSQFSKSLFEEVRKNDVKVITIYPDMTKTNFYENNTYFECDDDEKAYIKMEDIGNMIEFILNQSENIVFTDIIIKPQRHKIKKVKRTVPFLEFPEMVKKRHYIYEYPEKLIKNDDKKIELICEKVSGKKDFSEFTNKKGKQLKEKIREIFVSYKNKKLYFSGNKFLPQQVRIMSNFILNDKKSALSGKYLTLEKVEFSDEMKKLIFEKVEKFEDLFCKKNYFEKNKFEEISKYI